MAEKIQNFLIGVGMELSGGPPGIVPADEQHTNRGLTCQYTKGKGLNEKPCTSPAKFSVEDTRACGHHVSTAVEALALAMYQTYGSPAVEVMSDMVVDMIKAAGMKVSEPASAEPSPEPVSPAPSGAALSNDPFADGRNYT